MCKLLLAKAIINQNSRYDSYDLLIGEQQFGEKIDYNGTLSLPRKWAKPGQQGIFYWQSDFRCKITHIKAIHEKTNSIKEKITLDEGGPGKYNVTLKLGTIPSRIVDIQFIIYVKENIPGDSCKSRAYMASQDFLEFFSDCPFGENKELAWKMHEEARRANNASNISAKANLLYLSLVFFTIFLCS